MRPAKHTIKLKMACSHDSIHKQTFSKIAQALPGGANLGSWDQESGLDRSAIASLSM